MWSIPIKFNQIMPETSSISIMLAPYVCHSLLHITVILHPCQLLMFICQIILAP